MSFPILQKDAGETVTLEFEFDDVLVADEVLASCDDVTITPGSQVTEEGSPTVNSGDDSKSALQEVSGGTLGTDYTIKVTCTGSLGSPESHVYIKHFTLQIVES